MHLTPTEQRMLLQQLPHTGVAAHWRLLEHYPNLTNAFAAPAQDLRKILHSDAVNWLLEIQSSGEDHPALRQIRANQNWLEQRHIHIVDIDSDDYPLLLKETKRAPPLLYVWGDPTLLNLPQIAIVGSRSPTAGGRNNAQNFGQGLAAAGFTITSGLALGVDIAAHQGALKAGGKTLAVLGTGIDHIYPARHVHTAEQIASSGGAVISEFPLGTRALPSNFPQRNRIISGLSCGVLVVEAAIKSGSLITARYALQQNREVFAIPGSIQNPLSRGCHALIKDGAKLVESAEDITEELQGILAFKRSEVGVAKAPQQASLALEGAESASEVLILEQLGFDPVPFDTLAERTQVPAGELMATLLTMELKGLITNAGHGYARVRS
ncbi:DNA-processing protein DprA [Marinagarivorans cellulosilyticus]|uniref:DNA processing protein n=1 Tax=Marinagarivorans cellulosilyticus TaxID=2721545 RepID=A0AAN1WLA4_9GAMM|nr:DNA-processing protein DprA [Marinagarivorans cellulosilyticus]BCD99685.1 DNA processing protein [Marinagarivorans cellulosilyticus]